MTTTKKLTIVVVALAVALVCVVSGTLAFLVAQSDVVFAELTDEEIEYYVQKYCPMDKAGSYGVQEWIGYIGITGINGSYFNVMGLPVQRLYSELGKVKYRANESL